MLFPPVQFCCLAAVSAQQHVLNDMMPDIFFVYIYYAIMLYAIFPNEKKTSYQLEIYKPTTTEFQYPGKKPDERTTGVGYVDEQY